jgi:hypothetical protein
MPLFLPYSRQEGRIGKPFNWFNHASFSARLKTRGEGWKTINWFIHASFYARFKTRVGISITG